MKKHVIGRTVVARRRKRRLVGKRELVLLLGVVGLLVIVGIQLNQASAHSASDPGYTMNR